MQAEQEFRYNLLQYNIVHNGVTNDPHLQETRYMLAA
jgi:hypothetical protein